LKSAPLTSKKRTLTNLYNTGPTWLTLAHQNLHTAVFAAYGWDSAIPDNDLLAALLALNRQRAAGEKERGTVARGFSAYIVSQILTSPVIATSDKMKCASIPERPS
jgi:hypothetical protein